MPTTAVTAHTAELTLIQGDLSKLTADQRASYYLRVCESLGLNPLTRPFDYMTFQGKMILYARKDCTEQLRKRDGVSVSIVARETVEGCYVVTARATTPAGRTDESVGAVNIEGLKGDARANAIMKAETKAKRRVTLSVCGLGMLDETEADFAARVHVEPIPAPQAVTGGPADDDEVDVAELEFLLRKAGKRWEDVREALGERVDRELGDAELTDLTQPERRKFRDGLRATIDRKNKAAVDGLYSDHDRRGTDMSPLRA